MEEFGSATGKALLRRTQLSNPGGKLGEKGPNKGVRCDAFLEKIVAERDCEIPRLTW